MNRIDNLQRQVNETVEGLDEQSLNWMPLGQDTREALDPLTLEQLREARTAVGRTFTVQACLLYLIEHLAFHLGHMQLTRQMYNPKITGSQSKRARAR